MQWGRFLVPPMASTKLQQSLAAFERAFVEEAEADRLRRERIYREAEQRLDTRRRDRVHKHGSMRFALLVLASASSDLALDDARDTSAAVPGRAVVA